MLFEECRKMPAPYVLDASSIHATEGTVSLEEYESLYKIQIIDAPIVNVSSTEIRQKREQGLDVSDLLM